ncbi:ABC transporter substrate-binding protein [Streptomyces sp. URMC 123]|uniref:ABC transporter substrate-binding protein n=1 Tax=Streptomyces sp. URMC 123 TaxID=3423403 RepID=UPI003F1B6391
MRLRAQDESWRDDSIRSGSRSAFRAAGGGSALTRRGLLAAGGALGAGVLLSACGDGDSSGGGGKDSKAWSFQDDRGVTAKADRTPQRVVAYVASAAALHDLGVSCVGIFGSSQFKDGRPTPQAGSLDLAKLTSVGSVTGQFNIEKYAGLRPDLLVSNVNQPPALWSIPEESSEKILGFAPSVGIKTAGVSLLTAVQRYAALAESLGADLKAAKVTEAKARFEAAAERLRRAAKAKGGLKVLAAAAQADAFSAGVPDIFPDTRYYKELGVEFISPRNPGAAGFWEKLSWENADTYPADVIFLDQRANNLQLPELTSSKPTWRELPAVKAGQVVAWNNEAQFSYAGYAPLIERLAEGVEKAKKLT